MAHINYIKWGFVPMRIVTAVLSLSLTVAATAVAQMPAPSPEMMAARDKMTKSCQADMKSLCGGKDGREAMMCLRSAPPEKLSGGCKGAMDELAKFMRPRQ
jgi:hypothetical protein